MQEKYSTGIFNRYVTNYSISNNNNNNKFRFQPPRTVAQAAVSVSRVPETWLHILPIIALNDYRGPRRRKMTRQPQQAPRRRSRIRPTREDTTALPKSPYKTVPRVSVAKPTPSM